MIDKSILEEEIKDPFFVEGVDSGVNGILLREIPLIEEVNGAFLPTVDGAFYDLRVIPWAYLHRDGKWRFTATNPKTKDMFTGAYFKTHEEAEAFLESQKPQLRVITIEEENIVLCDGNGNFLEFLKSR